VIGSVPLYRLVDPAGGEVLSPSPYALSDPPYDGATARWELLGYAFEAGREPPAPEGFASVAIEDALGASPYRAEGVALRVLRPAARSTDADVGTEAAPDVGPPDAASVALDGGRPDAFAAAPDEGPSTPDVVDVGLPPRDARAEVETAEAPAPGEGCGCRTAGAPRSGPLMALLAALALWQGPRRGAGRPGARRHSGQRSTSASR